MHSRTQQNLGQGLGSKLTPCLKVKMNILEKTRLQRDPIVVFQCIGGLVGMTEKDFLPGCVATGQRGNGFKLKDGRIRMDIRKKFLMLIMVGYRNRLPRENVAAPSLEVFKARLDAALGSLICWVVSLPFITGGWPKWSFSVPSNPNHSINEFVGYHNPNLGPKSPCQQMESQCSQQLLFQCFPKQKYSAFLLHLSSSSQATQEYDLQPDAASVGLPVSRVKQDHKSWWCVSPGLTSLLNSLALCTENCQFSEKLTLPVKPNMKLLFICVEKPTEIKKQLIILVIQCKETQSCSTVVTVM